VGDRRKAGLLYFIVSIIPNANNVVGDQQASHCNILVHIEFIKDST
jgi:hypothetical protein